MKKQFFFSAFLLLLCSGCALSNPIRKAEAVTLPFDAVAESLAKSRTAQFKEILAPMAVRGIGIDLTSTIPENITPAFVADRVMSLGFNTLYCYITSEQELTSELRDFLIECGKRKLALELVLFQSDFRTRQRGNAVIRGLWKNSPRLSELGENIADFNRKLPANAKLAGVTAFFEPHSCTFENGATKVPGLCFVWNENTFGKGLDNDQLALLSLAEFRKMQKSLKGIPMSIAVYDYYHEWAESGKLSIGRITDFAGFHRTLLIATGSKPSELLSGVANECKLKSGIVPAVKIAGHTSVEQGALRRRDWADLIRSLKLLVQQAQQNRCGGLVISPLSELIYMLHEKN